MLPVVRVLPFYSSRYTDVTVNGLSISCKLHIIGSLLLNHARTQHAAAAYMYPPAVGIMFGINTFPTT